MSSLHNFIEDFQDEADPLDGHGCEQFDMETVLRNLGEAEAIAETDREKLGKALLAILAFVLGNELGRKQDAAKFVGRRFLAFAWVLNPDFFGGASLTEIATLLGVHKATLSPHAADASRTFSIRNRGQSHAWNFSRSRTKRERKRTA